MYPVKEEQFSFVAHKGGFMLRYCGRDIGEVRSDTGGMGHRGLKAMMMEQRFKEMAETMIKDICDTQYISEPYRSEILKIQEELMGLNSENE